MKLEINFDFWEAIRDAREPLTTLKLLRKNRRISTLALGFDIIFQIDPKILPFAFIGQVAYFVLGDRIFFHLVGADLYQEKASNQLTTLVPKLEQLHVSTNYNLLTQSELEEKSYKIQLNENKLPELLESKYILVPTYDSNDNIKETSIMQEHVIGTKQYVLTLGSRRNVRQPIPKIA